MFSSSIVGDILAQDTVSQHLLSNARFITPGVLAVVDRMEKAGLARLQEYLYWVVASYENVLLRPFDGDMNLCRVTGKLIELVQAATASSELTQDQFTQVMSVFEDQMRGILLQVARHLQSSPQLRRHKQALRFSAHQLYVLNTQGFLDLDFFSSNLLPPFEQNHRVVDMVVSSLEVKLAPGVCYSLYVRCIVCMLVLCVLVRIVRIVCIVCIV